MRSIVLRDSRLFKLFPAVAALFLVLAIAGCGTLDVDLHLTVRDDGGSVAMTVKGTGALGNALISDNTKDSLTSQGWKNITVDRQSDVVTIHAVSDSADILRRPNVTLSKPEAGQAAQKDILETFTLERGGNFFVSTYAVRMKSKPGEPPSTASAGPQLIDQATLFQIINNMLRVKMSITLPGEIQETNADNHTVDTATWYLDYNALTKGREMYVTSRRVNLLNIAVVGGGLLVLAIAMLVLGLRSRRRRHRHSLKNMPCSSRWCRRIKGFLGH